MPIYVYKCPRCGRVIELQRSIANMDAPQSCPNLCARDGEYVKMTRQLTVPSRPVIK